MARSMPNNGIGAIEAEDHQIHASMGVEAILVVVDKQLS